MLGTILWNTGTLGAWSPFNLISFSPTLGSAASSKVAGSVQSGIGTHTAEIFTAHMLEAFVGDFYNRYHITTLVLDLGNLVSEQSEQITIWNAYRRSQILTGLDTDDAEGISISGQPTPPLLFAPLQELTWSVTISTSGPGVIDATITWHFTNGDVVLSVVGQRIVPWNWKPDWSQAMIERIQWYTDVIEAGRGEEQRRSMRIDPRQFLEFSATLEKDDRRIMESILWNWGARAWAVPLWFDGQQLAAGIASGVSSIPVSPDGRGFQVGELLMLTSGIPNDYEMVEVASLSGSVGLVRPTSRPWPIGTWVYPARTAIIENMATLSRFTGDAVSLRLQWRMTDPTTWAAAATPLYRSLPVLEHVPNWTEDPALALERKVSILDAGTGITMTIDKAQMPQTTQRMRYTLPNKAAIDTWKQRLWALRGKQGAVWVPTWSEDLSVIVDIAALSTNIDVEWVGYTRFLKMDPGRRDVRILARNGTIYYRRITGSTEVSASIERLSIDTALGTALAAADVMLVSFMALSRNESDVAEFAYFQGDVADTVFSARAFRTEQ